MVVEDNILQILIIVSPFGIDLEILYKYIRGGL